MRKGILLLAIGLAAALPSRAYDPINHWMLFNGNFVYDGKTVNSGTNLGNNNVNAIAQDAAGNIWMSVSGKGLRMWDGKKLASPALPKDSYLKDAEILSLATDSKGTIWVGTSEGLAMYNGQSWSNIGPEVTGIRAVRDIVVTPTDKVYISGLVSSGGAFTGGGLAFYNGSGWTQFNAGNSAVPDTMIQHLTLDANNHLWMTVGNDDMGLAKFDGKNWKVYNTGNGLPSNKVRAILAGKDGKMYFATTKGILDFDGSNWNMRPYSNSFGTKLLEEMGRNNGELDVTSLLLEDNGATWIGTRSGGVYTARPGAARFYDASNSLLPGGAIMKMMRDKDGNKWFVSGDYNWEWRKHYFERNHGLYTYNNNGVVALKEYGFANDPHWTIYDDQNFSPGLGTAFSIVEDKDGVIWIPSTAGGLTRVQNGAFSTVRHPGGDFANAFNRIYLAPDGKMFINTNMSGIKVYENGVIADYAKWPNMGGVLGMSYDKNNTLWSAGTGGLSHRVGDDWETFNKRKGDLPSVIIYCVFRDSKGTLWAGTAKGLVRYDEPTFKTFTKEEVEFPSDDIQCITEDKQGRIWVGSNRGLSIYDGTTWTHISKVESPRLKNFRVNDISFDKNGVAWLATEDAGLLRYDGTSWTQYDQRNSATLFDRVTAVKVASDGKVYVVSELPEFGQSTFGMPNATGDMAIQQGLETRVKAGDPKRVLAIITP